MEEINKFLTEAMGECWHEWDIIEDAPPFRKYKCNTCRDERINPKDNNDFSTWEGFGKLWEWSIDQDWWQKFLNVHNVSPDFRFRGFDTDLINPDEFAKAVFLYLSPEPPKEGE